MHTQYKWAPNVHTESDLPYSLVSCSNSFEPELSAASSSNSLSCIDMHAWVYSYRQNMYEMKRIPILH